MLKLGIYMSFGAIKLMKKTFLNEICVPEKNILANIKMPTEWVI